MGTLAACSAAAVASLLAALVSARAPVAAVAKRTIDAVPASIRRWAIETFGRADKLVLGVGIVVVLALAGAVVARLQEQRRWVTPVAVAGLAGVGLLAIDGPGALDVAVSIASALTAYVVFVLLRRGRSDSSPPTTGAAAEPMVRSRWQAPVDRRQFMARAGMISAATVGTAGVAAAVNRSENSSVATARRALPKVTPGTPAAASTVPPGAQVGSGVGPFITPTADFYRIDTAFVAPRVDLDSWRLRIGGAVEHPLELSYDQLLRRDVVERVITLCCVSNEIGGDLVGTARFLGVPLSALLAEAGVKPQGEQIKMTSDDGWTCGFPTALALDGRDALVAVGMNGEPLTVPHGFPARVVVPGLYGYVSGTKWVTSIDLVGWDEFDGYWIPRGWAKEGPVRTQSRIDVPRNGDSFSPGRRAIAGVAWAQHKGIARVEVRIDDGPWIEARLGDEVSVDAWRQWVVEWDARSGHHRLEVRATDRTGETQTAEVTQVAPSGATGHHSIEVDVG